MKHLEVAPDAMVIVREDGRITFVNRQAEALFGYDRAELLEQPIEILIPERFRGAHPHHRRAYAESPRARPMGAGLSLRALRKDGTEFTAEISLSSMETGEGNQVTAAIRDVTGRRQLEERYRAFLEAAPDAMVIVDRAGHVVIVNSQTENVFGYARAELVGKPVEVLVPERFREAHARHRAGFSAHPKVRAMGSGLDLYGLRRDGTEFPIEISLSPLEVEGGMLVLSAIRDVTERHRIENARAHLAAIVESSDDAILGLTLDGVVTSWNRSAERLFGWTAEEAIGKPVNLLVPEARADELPHLERPWKTDGSPHGDSVRLHKDGRRIEVSFTVSPVLDRRGAVVGTSAVLRDISERKRAEAALTEAKVAAERVSRELEMFSYSVAHDLRAPLRGMNGFAKVLLDDYAGSLDETGVDCLQEIQTNARRMGELIDALLALSRVTRSDLRRERVDLTVMAREVAAQLARADDARSVDWVVAEGLKVNMDPELARVLMENLLANAWKFTAHVDPARVEIGAVHTGERVELFVRDNGAGFDMAYADKLFAPFQRLHSISEFPGTGIGLATAQRIVVRHGGRIWAEGAVGAGATFHFAFDGETAC